MDLNEAVVIEDGNSPDVWEDLDTGDYNEESDTETDSGAESEDTTILSEEGDESAEESGDKSGEDSEESDELESGTAPDSDKVEDKEEKEEETETEEEGDQASELTLESLQESIDKGEFATTVKVDGEELDITLQELKNNYSGKVSYDKKFSEFDKERKTHKEEYDKITNYVNSFAEKMNEGDAIGAFEFFGQFANIPPYMIKEQLIAALKPEIERRSTLSGDQIQNENLIAQNEHLKTTQESSAKKLETEQANNALQGEISGIRETHSIDEVEWNGALKALDERLPKEEQITPKLVQEEILDIRITSKAGDLLFKFDAPLKDNSEWTNSLKNIIKQNPDFTDEDLADIIKEGAKQSGYKSTTSKLKTKIGKQNASKKLTTTKQSPQEETIDPELEELFDL